MIFQNFKHGVFGPGYGRYNQEDEGLHGESRRIACKKCNNFHVWLCTNRPKSQARRCQVLSVSSIENCEIILFWLF